MRIRQLPAMFWMAMALILEILTRFRLGAANAPERLNRPAEGSATPTLISSRRNNEAVRPESAFGVLPGWFPRPNEVYRTAPEFRINWTF
jgi:hypothetical protein